MKSIFIFCGAFPILATFAQETTIIGLLPSERPITKTIERSVAVPTGAHVLSTTHCDQGDHSITACLITPPTVGAARPAKQSAPQQLAENPPTSQSHLVLSATIVDGQATYLEWQANEQRYAAWSRVDFNELQGMSSCRKGDHQLSLMLLTKNVTSSASSYQIPRNLFSGEMEFIITEGDSNNQEVNECLKMLHEVHSSNHERLRKNKRKMAKRAERAAQKAARESRRNAGKKKKVIVYGWVSDEKGGNE